MERLSSLSGLTHGFVERGERDREMYADKVLCSLASIRNTSVLYKNPLKVFTSSR